ncbi:MAG: hypothetical protein ABIS30_10080, partial [Gallionella sp.]
MVDTINVDRQQAKQWNTLKFLGISIFTGCAVMSMPAFADSEAERMKAMENKLESLQTELTQVTEGMAKRSSAEDGLPIHGFMDVGFATNSWGTSAGPMGFNGGALSFYLSPHFGDRVKALVEPNFEVTPEGAVATDLERLQIAYTFSDAATLWTGRFHTPYGYWNTAFHHGAQIQTSVLRPRFLDFEDKGGILPAHMVGLWDTGKFNAGEGKLTYDVFAGNGPKIVLANSTAPPTPTNLGTLDINFAGDNNHQAMVGFNLGYEFSGNMDGLRLAVHGIRGDVDDNAPMQFNKTGLNMLGGSAVYLSDAWEVMSEYYGFNDKDKSGSSGTHKSKAGYLQVATTFNRLTPYIRFERAILDQADNYFSMQASGQSYARQALGLRYNLNQKAALKFELLNSSFKA